MRSIAPTLRAWLASAEPLCLATVVNVSGSAPRPVGATMAVRASGAVAGSVSGGCVEGAVVDVARSVLDDGVPRLVSYGISDEEALTVGLTCGGTLDILINPVDGKSRHVLAATLDGLLQGAPAALATLVDGPGPHGAMLAVRPDGHAGTLGNEGLDVGVLDDALGMMAAGEVGSRHYGARGERRRDEVTVFIESFVPPPRMIVFGAIDFAAATAAIGKFLGYTVTVCDARGVFATPDRFPDADEVVVEWPHRYLRHAAVDERTVLCVLTHDPKFDTPLLEAALATPAAYIGVMGSRRTHALRLAELRRRGVAEDALARLRAPIGLDLGARTAAETAVSIAAEIIAATSDGSGRPLTELSGRIHHSMARV